MSTAVTQSRSICKSFTSGFYTTCRVTYYCCVANKYVLNCVYYNSFCTLLYWTPYKHTITNAPSDGNLKASEVKYRRHSLLGWIGDCVVCRNKAPRVKEFVWIIELLHIIHYIIISRSYSGTRSYGQRRRYSCNLQSGGRARWGGVDCEQLFNITSSATHIE